MSLINTFEQMKAEESEKTASSEYQYTEGNEEREILAKYAEWSEDQLKTEYGEGNYSEEDVEKLAEAKIQADAAEQENREKVAEYFEAGQIMYAGFKAAADADGQE